ncbi:MAG TPA: hypothetical protein VGY77_07930 [Gemmataceae bacterium]|jgi:hypothetical protein|nr:hypothetical protein [Gemmataceae bacterium]
MYSIRTWAFGFLLAGTLTGAAVFAQSGVAPVPAPPGYGGPGTVAYPGSPGGIFSPYQSQSAQLAHQYVKAAKEEDKKEIRKKLVDSLNQQFDHQIQQQQKELEELEKQIAELKAVLKKRMDAKTTIVERRIDQLVQEADGLGWTSPGTPRPVYGPMMGGGARFSPGAAPATAPAPKP